MQKIKSFFDAALIYSFRKMFIRISAYLQSNMLTSQLGCPKDRRTIERVCSYYKEQEIQEALKSTLHYSRENKIKKDKLSYFIGTLKRIRNRNKASP